MEFHVVPLGTRSDVADVPGGLDTVTARRSTDDLTSMEQFGNTDLAPSSVNFIPTHATDPGPILASAPAHLPTVASTTDRADAGFAVGSNGLRGERARWMRRYQAVAVVLDLAAAFLAGVLAMTIRFGNDVRPHYVLIGLFAPLAWLVAIAMARGYERRFLGVGTEEYRSVVQANLVMLAAIGFGSYATKTTIARGFVIVFVPSALLLALLFRYVLRQHVHRLRARGRCMLRTVVVGRVESAAELVATIDADPSHGLSIVAVCASGFDPNGKIGHIQGVPWLGSSEDTLAAVDLVDADVVAVSSRSDLVGGELRRLSWGLEERKVDLIVAPGIMEVAGPRLSIRPAAGLALLHVERPVASLGRQVAKIAFDRTVGVLLCVLAAPVMVFVALAIKIDNPGPVFFRQRRAGASGRQFEMIKFRSMVVDAEAKLAQVLSDHGGHDGNDMMFKQREDPRITRVGRLLRRYSLDELPQLINVVVGDMSLVGPRPPLMAEVEAYEPDAIRRLHVRPGMTGLWQVSGRSDLSWEDTLRLDLRYVDNWSIMLDLQILWRTGRAVFTGSGAY